MSGHPLGRGLYNFTDHVREALQLAREEALRLRHEYVGTEHMLLGLIAQTENTALALLKDFKVDPPAIKHRIEEGVKKGEGAVREEPDLPYTSRARKVIELAMSEARELNHSYVGTEHLLLGLLREEKGIAAQVLTAAGVTIKSARDAIVRLRGASPPPSEGTSAFRIQIDDASDRSIYEQIVAQIREAVATGTVRPGDRLPPVRQLADELDIAPGTVARAYSELERRGVVITDGARGTRVSEAPRSTNPENRRPENLVGLLRPVAVAAYHLGASAEELRRALEDAMRDIFGGTAKPTSA